MKKFRFVLVALLLAGVTAAFAFSNHTAPKVKRDTSWFQYSPTHDGGTSNPENYVMVSSEPTARVPVHYVLLKHRSLMVFLILTTSSASAANNRKKGDAKVKANAFLHWLFYLFS